MNRGTPSRRTSRALGVALLALALGGCSSVGYYAQLARGQYALLEARRPIAEVIADPATDAALREHLKLAQEARVFASDRLGLPRNGSYTLYADLGRPAAVWNVFATSEFSLTALTHCFPIAGCVAYRGYYDRAAAQAEADRLTGAGYDTEVSGSPAYSTLGWFDDPILNTMLGWGDDALDSSIFHELAHQKLYLKGDTAFNESFATFVEEEGLRQWRAAHGEPAQSSKDETREAQFTQLVLDARERLTKLYASGLPVEEMRAGKQREFERLRTDYAQLRDTQWSGDRRYDGWFNRPINNARLLPFGLYHRWVPAFAALYAQAQGDWAAFFAAAKTLSREKTPARENALEELALRAAKTVSP